MYSEKTQAVLNLLGECYKEAYKSREEDISIQLPMAPFSIDSHPWKLYQDFYDGDQWSRLGRFPSWKSRPVDNICFRAVESYSTLLTDNRPSIDVVPSEEADYNLAKIVKAGVLHWWDKQDMDVKLASVVKLSRIYGLGWLHLRHSKADGNVCDVVHPENILVDPDCTAERFDPTYLIYEFRTQVGDLKKNYKKDAYGDEIDWESFNADWEAGSALNQGNIVQKVFSQFRRATRSPAKSCNVYKFYTKDDSTIMFDQEYDDIVVTKRKKKFANGRVLLVAGGIVLEDKENEDKHGKFPFVPVFAYPIAGKFYCPGDIQGIISQQIMTNYMNQLIFDGTKKAGGGIVLTNPNYGLTKDMITNDVIQIHEVQDVSRAMSIKSFPSPPRHVFDYIGVLARQGQDAIGLHDISNGAFTPGNKTAEEVAVISESDKTRVRMASRYLAWSVRILGRMVLSNMAQYDDWEYFVRIAGNYEDEDEPVEVGMPVSASTMRRMDGDKLTEEAIEFDLKVEEGSTLPASQNERMQMAAQLFSQEVIDAEEYLKAINWPNYKAVLARVNEKNQAAQQAQMQAQQAQMQQQQPQMPQGAPQQGMPPQGMPPQEMGGGLPPDIPPELQQIIMERSQAEGRDPMKILQEMLAEEEGVGGGM